MTINTALWQGDPLARAREALARLRANPAPAAALPTSRAQLAAMIDHTLLKPEATAAQVEALCAEARTNGFASVCVNAWHVPLCVKLLAGSAVRVCSVAGFPLGATSPAVKAYEATLVVAQGAHEVDMVLNVGALKGGQYDVVREDVAGVAAACRAQGAHSKVIFETCLLADEEKVLACWLCVEAGADFVKTSTGLNAAGATVADVALMRAVVGPQVGVKAAGGIRDSETAFAMVRAGASRIGASASLKIIQGLPA
jgi:deoxyribose-phosphate aldolase